MRQLEHSPSLLWSNKFTLSIAVIALIQGALADAIGIGYSYFLQVFCYVDITFFAVYWMGNKMI